MSFSGHDAALAFCLVYEDYVTGGAYNGLSVILLRVYGGVSGDGAEDLALMSASPGMTAPALSGARRLDFLKWAGTG